MSRDARHELLAQPTRQEQARQNFVLSAKRFLNSQLRRHNTALPVTTGEGTLDRASARDALFAHPLYRIWSALNRSAQEMMWLSVGESVVREEPRVREAWERHAAADRRRGSLTLDDQGMEPGDSERALEDHFVHLQPGGYLLDRDGGDLLAGALYESGGNLYSFGQGMGQRDSKAKCVIRFLEAEYAIKPQRILDLGCSAGAASCDYAGHWPDAEVHAIDLGRGLLRYAHGRAEALGVAVHFRRMDVSRLRYPDASFDLVVSHNLLHEISSDVRRAMFREVRRVLRPGGIAVMQDVPLRLAREPVLSQADKVWDVDHNNELFWEHFADADLVSELADCGFSAAAVREEMLPRIDGPGGWYAVISEA